MDAIVLPVMVVNVGLWETAETALLHVPYLAMASARRIGSVGYGCRLAGYVFPSSITMSIIARAPKNLEEQEQAALENYELLQNE